MSAVELTLTVLAALLALAALPTVHRMVVGPTILDRTVATDMLVVLVVLGLALYSAATGTTWAVTSMLALTAFAFVGTVAVARFVAREEPRGARARAQHPAGRGGAMTGQHDAIHPEVAETSGDRGSAASSPSPQDSSFAAGQDTSLWSQDHADWSDVPTGPTGPAQASGAAAADEPPADDERLADVDPPHDDAAADAPAEIDADDGSASAGALADALDDDAGDGAPGRDGADADDRRGGGPR